MTKQTTPWWLSALQGGQHIADRVHNDFLLLFARIFPAAIFWQSGQTKIQGWQLNDSALYLFQEEYHLPLIDPVVAAHLAAFAEHFFPFLLLVGLASRLSAVALLGMIAVIQIFVYPDAWPTHGVWAISLLLVATRGPGRWSVDAFCWQRIQTHFASSPSLS